MTRAGGDCVLKPVTHAAFVLYYIVRIFLFFYFSLLFFSVEAVCT